MANFLWPFRDRPLVATIEHQVEAILYPIVVDGSPHERPARQRGTGHLHDVLQHPQLEGSGVMRSAHRLIRIAALTVTLCAAVILTSAGTASADIVWDGSHSGAFSIAAVK
jgi:hypothetical protein